jgi:hypothetical protein
MQWKLRIDLFALTINISVYFKIYIICMLLLVVDAGTRTYEDQAYWTNYTRQRGSFWSLLGCWKPDTLREVLLSTFFWGEINFACLLSSALNSDVISVQRVHNHMITCFKG